MHTEDLSATHPPDQILFDRYKVVACIGRGGMAFVYKVFDKVENKILALKTLIPSPQNPEKAITRFRNEFTAMQALSHPHIVHAYNFHETDDGQAGFSMELIEGEDLDAIINEGKYSLSIEEKVDLIGQIAEGLFYAHEHEFIHCDLKPANILIFKDDNEKLLAKITDFGLTQASSDCADMSKSSNQIGTTYYMAPEQHRGELLSNRTDIYSFGILAYELFTGQRPFDGCTPFSLFLAHASKSIPEPKKMNPEIPSWISTMIEICAEKETKHRYLSMKEVVDLIGVKKNKKVNWWGCFLGGRG